MTILSRNCLRALDAPILLSIKKSAAHLGGASNPVPWKGLHPVARHPVVVADVAPLRNSHSALVNGNRASRVEITAGRRPQWTGHIAGKDNPLAFRLDD